MRKFNLLLLFVLLIGAACEGPPGLPGPQGLQGPQGQSGVAGLEAFVIEYENINFVAPDYEVLLEYDDVEAIDDDVVLVYFLWGTEVDNGETLELWRLLPQSIETNLGRVNYNFEWTKRYAYVFMDANFPLSQAGADLTDGWVARVVVIPGRNVDGRTKQVDYADYNAVKEAYGIPEIPLRKGTIVNRPG